MVENTRMVDKELMKRSNMRLVFEQIYRHQGITRPQIARNVGLSVMTTGRLADELVALGLVGEGQREEAAPGRPAMVLRVAAERLLCAGAFIDRDCVRVGLADPYGRIVAHRQRTFPVDATPVDETLDALADLLQELTSKAPRKKTKPFLGVAVPGIVRHDAGIVRFSSQLKWSDVDLSGGLTARLPGWQVAVDNDLKAWAQAESRFGASQGYANAVFLSVGSGIGAAAIVDNAIHRGRDNSAGEIGHVVIDPGGRLCNCGRIGCLQTKFADWAILQDARTIKSDATLDDIFAAGGEKPPWAEALRQRAVDYIALSVNLLVNTYAPEILVLGGYLFTHYPGLVTLVQQAHRAAAVKNFIPDVEMTATTFGDDNAMVGGAALGFIRYLRACTGG